MFNYICIVAGDAGVVVVVAVEDMTEVRVMTVTVLSAPAMEEGMEEKLVKEVTGVVVVTGETGN